MAKRRYDDRLLIVRPQGALPQPGKEYKAKDLFGDGVETFTVRNILSMEWNALNELLVLVEIE